MTIQGVIRGKTIELASAPEIPDGQTVTVTIEPMVSQMAAAKPNAAPPPVESWLDRLVFDPSVEPLGRVVKGTRLLAESLVHELEQGRSDAEMMRAHQELTPEDMSALRCYAHWPAGLRRSFGGWAEDAGELDQYLQWTRQQRKISRREEIVD
jgi:uncharacterized protein (DUF433 family)